MSKKLFVTGSNYRDRTINTPQMMFGIHTQADSRTEPIFFIKFKNLKERVVSDIVKFGIQLNKCGCLTTRSENSIYSFHIGAKILFFSLSRVKISVLECLLIFSFK